MPRSAHYGTSYPARAWRSRSCWRASRVKSGRMASRFVSRPQWAAMRSGVTITTGSRAVGTFCWESGEVMELVVSVSLWPAKHINEEFQRGFTGSCEQIETVYLEPSACWQGCLLWCCLGEGLGTQHLCPVIDNQTWSHLTWLSFNSLRVEQWLTKVLDVDRELEGLLELSVDAGGSLPQKHREFSESIKV